jgi:hypothetical protein
MVALVTWHGILHLHALQWKKPHAAVILISFGYLGIVHTVQQPDKKATIGKIQWIIFSSQIRRPRLAKYNELIYEVSYVSPKHIIWGVTNS